MVRFCLVDVRKVSGFVVPIQCASKASSLNKIYFGVFNESIPYGTSKH